MNKKGFTLQETLITLGIIGIVAAITVPGLAKMMPNRDQQLVVKAYQTLTDLTNQMLVDPALYWSDGNCDGLSCTDVPRQGTIPNELFQTLDSARPLNMTNKYANILAFYMHKIDVSNGNNIAFTAADGVVWVISAFADNAGNPSGIQVSLDTDGVLPNGNLVFATGNNVPADPNFAFIVSPDGRVDAGDKLTRIFLDDPTAKIKKNEYFDKVENIGIENEAGNVSVSGFCSENNNGQFICHAQNGNEIFGNNTAPLTISMNQYPVLNSAAGITFPY